MPKVVKLTQEAAQAYAKQKPQPIAPVLTGALPEPANATIFWVETLAIKPAPWNPPGRTTHRAVLDLIRRMQEKGFEPFRPILLSKDGYIGDGHRRWAAAQYLGINRVPVIYTEQSVEDLWAGNLGARPALAKEWMAVHIRGGVKNLPKNTANQVEQLLIIMGEEGVCYLIDRGISPALYTTVWRIGMYCKRTDLTFLRKLTYWLVKHKMSDKIRKATSATADEPIDPRLLIQAIESDIPIRPVWAVQEGRS